MCLVLNLFPWNPDYNTQSGVLKLRTQPGQNLDGGFVKLKGKTQPATSGFSPQSEVAATSNLKPLNLWKFIMLQCKTNIMSLLTHCFHTGWCLRLAPLAKTWAQSPGQASPRGGTLSKTARGVCPQWRAHRRARSWARSPWRHWWLPGKSQRHSG